MGADIDGESALDQFGYAVEYDSVDPRELNATLETKKIKSLFFEENRPASSPGPIKILEESLY